MRRSFLRLSLVLSGLLLGACHGAPESELSPAEDAPGPVAAEAHSGSGASVITAQSVPTWQYVTTIQCYQATGHNCYVNAWNPRCPSDPDSKECWSEGTTCYRVADDYEVEVFECVNVGREMSGDASAH